MGPVLFSHLLYFKNDKAAPYSYQGSALSGWKESLILSKAAGFTFYHLPGDKDEVGGARRIGKGFAL